MPVKIGETYGRLTTVTLVRKPRASGQLEKYFICRCTCGNTTKPIISQSLSNGDTKSCGCWRVLYNRNHRRLVKWQETHNYPRVRGKRKCQQA